MLFVQCAKLCTDYIDFQFCKGTGFSIVRQNDGCNWSYPDRTFFMTFKLELV